MLQIIVCNFEMHFICTMDFEYEVQFVKFSICYMLFFLCRLKMSIFCLTTRFVHKYQIYLPIVYNIH